MKNYLGFACGLIAGCIGLLLAQNLTKSPPAESPPPEPAKGSLASRHQGQQLSGARERITELEAEIARLQSADGVEVARERGEGTEAKGEGGDKAASIVEMMMSFGDEGTKRKVEREVGRLAEILGLTENQQAVVREALLEKASSQKAAGVRLVTGRASMADLITSDEHNFEIVDVAIAGILDEEQLGLFETEQSARELRRVETKTEEEIGNLASEIELGEDQRDAAWQVLAEINAGEKPGAMPDDVSGEDFIDLVDAAIGKRVDGLTPILTAEQLQVYEGQTEDFRKMITTLVGHASGAPLEQAPGE